MGPGQWMELATPGSAVRLAYVARHVTDCATRPGNETVFELLQIDMGKSCETVFGWSFQRDFDSNLKRGHNDKNFYWQR